MVTTPITHHPSPEVNHPSPITHHPICAIATAQGGAIGVIRISGKDSITIVDGVFVPKTKDKSPLSARPPYTIVYGSIVASKAPSPATRHPSPNDVIDEVLVSIFRAPHSYTGEDSVEISCHGSAYILQSVLQLLISKGCRMAGPGEFTRRAFMNGKMDLAQAEAVADLIASSSAATHRMAMNQMRGAFSGELEKLRQRLLHLTSLLELELDFSDHEELEFADRSELTDLIDQTRQLISRLTSSFCLGNVLKNGVPVAIIGAPNVGKSTLLNALLKDDRAIVSDIQGTTRDVIEDTVTLRDIDFRFIDTAGIRHTDDTIEQMGIERSLRAAEKAQIIILLTEPGVPFVDIPVRDDQTVIKIINKTPDFQALHGIGIAELEDQLIAAIPYDEGESVIVSNVRHYEALTNALTALDRAAEALTAGLPADLVSQDTRECIHHLATITGQEITTTAVLENIFKHHCIGK